MANFSDWLSRLETGPLPLLFPRASRDSSVSAALLSADLFDKSSDMAACIRAGLLLFNDDLDAAHRIVQAVETPTGSFWHAIIHRREGDFGNSRYWWEKTGAHAAFGAILEAVSPLLNDAEVPPNLVNALESQKEWRPGALLSACEAAWRADFEPEILQKIQRAEMQTLLDWCAENLEK